MKKLLLSVSALLLSLSFAKAQGYQTTGAWDDFGQTAFYKNGTNQDQEGVVWWGDAPFAFTRNGDGKLTVAATNAGGCGSCYPLIGVNFNDSNNDGTGTPYTVDLLTGSMADIKIDIENTSSQLLFMDVKLVDINDVQSGIEPNISDVAGKTWADPQRKALNGFTVAAGQRKTVRLYLSYVNGVIGGLTIGNYTCSGPSDCPTTSYTLDASKIKAVLFRVNFGNSNIDLSEGDNDYTTETFISGGTITAFTGNIIIHDFKIGSPVTSNVNESVIDNSLSVYPNPANGVLNVSFDAVEAANVTLTDIVGNNVYTSTTNAGSNKVAVNTSGYPSGMYILNVGTENGKVARKVFIK